MKIGKDVAYTRKGTGKKKPSATLARPLARTIREDSPTDLWLVANNKPVEIMPADALSNAPCADNATVRPAGKGKDILVFTAVESDYEGLASAEEEGIVSWESLTATEQEAFCVLDAKDSHLSVHLAEASGQWAIESSLWHVLRSERDAYGRHDASTTPHNLQRLGLNSRPTWQFNGSPTLEGKPNNWQVEDYRQTQLDFFREKNERLPYEHHTRALLTLDAIVETAESIVARISLLNSKIALILSTVDGDSGVQRDKLSPKAERSVLRCEDEVTELLKRLESLSEYKALREELNGSLPDNRPPTSLECIASTWHTSALAVPSRVDNAYLDYLDSYKYFLTSWEDNHPVSSPQKLTKVVGGHKGASRKEYNLKLALLASSLASLASEDEEDNGTHARQQARLNRHYGALAARADRYVEVAICNPLLTAPCWQVEPISLTFGKVTRRVGQTTLASMPEVKKTLLASLTFSRFLDSLYGALSRIAEEMPLTAIADGATSILGEIIHA